VKHFNSCYLFDVLLRLTKHLVAVKAFEDSGSQQTWSFNWG